MNILQFRRCALVACTLILSSFLEACHRRDRLPGFPRVVLWAWERPEDLRWINPKETGVALLAKTIYLGRQHAYVKPRLQPLSVPRTAELIAVIRLEGPGAPESDKSWIASQILNTSKLP